MVGFPTRRLKCLKYNHPTQPQKVYSYRWFDLNHVSWTGSDQSGLPVIRWSVSSVKALPGGTSSPSISLDPNWRVQYLYKCICVTSYLSSVIDLATYSTLPLLPKSYNIETYCLVLSKLISHKYTFNFGFNGGYFLFNVRILFHRTDPDHHCQGTN